MIIGFASKETEKIWNGFKKLRMLNNARDLNDLRIPPNNQIID